jgi:hypothetical protein
MCKSGLYDTDTGGAIALTKCSGGDEYVCLNKVQAEARGVSSSKCRSWQKPFAGILDGIWKKNKIEGCQTKAYMVAGVGLILLLAVL